MQLLIELVVARSSQNRWEVPGQLPQRSPARARLLLLYGYAKNECVSPHGLRLNLLIFLPLRGRHPRAGRMRSHRNSTECVKTSPLTGLFSMD